MSKEKNEATDLLKNIEAEKSLLGAIIINNNVMIDLGGDLQANDFFLSEHQAIMFAVSSLFNKHQPIDFLTLSNELTVLGKLESAGGIEYLTELIDRVPSATHFKAYASIVKQSSIRRKLIKAGDDISSLANIAENTPEELIELAEKSLGEVSETSTSGDSLVKIGSILSETFDRIEKLSSNPGGLRGLKTGFVDLDKKTAGLQASDLIILGARPAMGKTTFSTNLAYNAANYNKKTVLFFSLEMGKEQLIERMLADAASIDSWKIRTGNLSGDDFSRLTEAMGEMAEAPIQFFDGGGLTITGLRTLLRRAQRESEVGLIVIDYLQLMSDPIADRNGNEVLKLSNISRGLKLIAREFNVPVIALSQLNRDVAKDGRSSKIPNLADLRGSGSIEQDADIVMFLHREEYYNENTERKNITDLIIAKHRNGPVGRIELYFHPELLKFVSLDKGHA